MNKLKILGKDQINIIEKKHGTVNIHSNEIKQETLDRLVSMPLNDNSKPVISKLSDDLFILLGYISENKQELDPLGR